MHFHSTAQNPLHQLPRNFPVDREVVNKSATSWQQVCCVVCEATPTPQTQRTFVTFALATVPATPRPACASTNQIAAKNVTAFITSYLS